MRYSGRSSVLNSSSLVVAQSGTILPKATLGQQPSRLIFSLRQQSFTAAHWCPARPFGFMSDVAVQSGTH